MSFEEEFPSLDNRDWCEGGGYMQDSISDNCIDKQKVKEAICKLLENTNELHYLVCGSCDENWETFLKELGL